MESTHISFGKAVRVVWEDSAQIGGWRTGPVFPDSGKIESIGYCAGTAGSCIAITTSINDEGSVMSPLSIPFSCISELKELDIP